jgi:hypothetical protein
MADIIKGIRDFIVNEPKPVAQPVVQPVAQPVAQPVVQQVAQPVAQPVAQKVASIASYPLESSKSEKRSFTIIESDVVELGGRYLATTPIAAARKASRQIFKKTAHNLIRFVLKETTRGGDKKQFSYVANRELMKEPKIIRRGDREIKYTVTYTVKACLGTKEEAK